MVMRGAKHPPTLNASEDMHMAELYFDKEAKLWRADKVDFGTGSISVRIRFAHSGNTTLGYIKADGKIPPVIWSSEELDDETVADLIDEFDAGSDVRVIYGAGEHSELHKRI